jgi:hypothetical protein
MKRLIDLGLLIMILMNPIWADVGDISGDSLLNVERVGPKTEKVDEDVYEKVWYVSITSGSDSIGDGSQNNPWKTVISALLKISNESESHRYAIFVASGIYEQGTIYMQEWIDLYGGFNPETWERDLVKNRSILDGRGLRRVVIGRNNTRIDGFIIANGLSRSHGAGILCDDTSPIISNNTITNNLVLEPENFNRDRIHQEGYHGGGIACLFNSVPVIKNNLIVGNRTSVGTGAGIAFYGWVRIDGAPTTSVEKNVLVGGLTATVENNVIVGNISGINDFSRTRSSSGGGISCAHEARPVIRNNVVVGNEARGRSDAGGIYSEYYSYPSIEGNWILGNICDDDGGGFYAMKMGNPLLFKNIIAGNWTHGGGVGGIRISKEGRATIMGNLIIYNPGGGVRSVDSYMEFEDNIVLYNSGASGVGYVNHYSYMKTSIIKNNVIRDNEDGAIRIDDVSVSGAQVANNNVDDDWKTKGENNFDRIPLFREKGKIGKAIKIDFDPNSYLSILTFESNSKINNGLTGKVIRLGNNWGVIKDQKDNSLRIWGLIDSSGKELVEFEILPSYLK